MKANKDRTGVSCNEKTHVSRETRGLHVTVLRGLTESRDLRRTEQSGEALDQFFLATDKSSQTFCQ